MSTRDELREAAQAVVDAYLADDTKGLLGACADLSVALATPPSPRSMRHGRRCEPHLRQRAHDGPVAGQPGDPRRPLVVRRHRGPALVEGE